MKNRTIVCRDIESPLGTMIAGATEKGVCFLEWHDRGDLKQVKSRLEKRLGGPVSEGTNRHLDQLDSELSDYFDGKLKKFKVRIDVHGTPFQMADWDQLLKIPYGETRSYGEIAKAMGKPGASRAVGRANGLNFVSIVIPCHRVIDSNGNLHGYGGKIWRKKKLLELEKTNVQTELL